MNKTFLWCILLGIAAVPLTVLFFKIPRGEMVFPSFAPNAYMTPQYNPQSLMWTEATSSAEWQPRDSAASFVFRDKMWIMGGLNGNADVDSAHTIRYWEAPHLNDIWTSDDGVYWKEEKEHAEWLPRRSMSVVLFQDKLWMFGGWSPFSGYTNDIWQSDDGLTWEEVVSNAPWTAREGQVAEIFQGRIWMMGGVNYDTREVKNDVWYSNDGIHWNQATSTVPWRPRWDHASAVFKGRLFIAGGMNLTKETFKDIWVSSDGMMWELANVAPPWQERQGFALINFHDMLWTIGRLNDSENGGLNDIWYSDDGISWHKTAADPAWLGREDHAALLFKDRMYVYGGMGADWQWRNDVWISSK